MRCLEGAGGQQRMGEADPLLVRLDDTSLEGGVRPRSRFTPVAVSAIEIVGCACAAAATRKSRLSCGRERRRS
jgi:hypothetical protein